MTHFDFFMSDLDIAPKEDDTETEFGEKSVEGGKAWMGIIYQNIII